MTVESAYALIAMLVVMAAVGLLSRRVNTPYPVMLIMGGLALSWVPGIQLPRLDPNLILLFVLPPLLYKEAFHTSLHDFTRWLRPILMLAVGLVIVTVLAVGAVMHWLVPDLPWAACFILGAIISPTDTVAAMSVIHRLRVPRRLSAILGGESLVNDATGLVALQLAVGVVLSGVFSVGDIAAEFAWTACGGVGIGLIVGIAGHLANRVTRDTTILFTFSLITPYIAFAAAHAVHASGVLAVVVAGFYVSWRIHRMAADTRYQLFTVWRLMVYLIDGITFVLIGCELPRLFADGAEMQPRLLLIAGALITLTVIAVRFAWIIPMTYVTLWLAPAMRAREGGYPAFRNTILASWCGMRGGVSLAAALSVPLLAHDAPFPGRALIVGCTICVIIGTLVLQGLTLHPLIRLLGIRDESGEPEEERLARISMIQAALGRLDALRSSGAADAEAIDYVEAMYMERLRILSGHAAASDGHAGPPRHAFAVELAALKAARKRLLHLRDEANVNDMTQARLQEELDISEMRLQNMSTGAPA